MKIKTLIIFSILFVGIGAILFIRKNKPIDHLNEIIVTTNSPNHSVEDSITYEDFLLEVKSKKQNFTNNNEAKNIFLKFLTIRFQNIGLAQNGISMEQVENQKKEQLLVGIL